MLAKRRLVYRFMIVQAKRILLENQRVAKDARLEAGLNQKAAYAHRGPGVRPFLCASIIAPLLYGVLKQQGWGEEGGGGGEDQQPTWGQQPTWHHRRQNPFVITQETAMAKGDLNFSTERAAG